MLVITIPGVEVFDESTNEFSTTKDQILTLEHSLVSLSKWESKWEKPFLSKTNKTYEESIDYVRCMTLTQNVSPSIYLGITNEVMSEISKYIDAPMTATTFSKNEPRKINRDIITTEIIYYWMVAYTIPWEAQKWHLNRLLTLINVCNIKNQPTKGMNKKAIYSRNAALNAARRQKLNSSG